MFEIREWFPLLVLISDNKHQTKKTLGFISEVKGQHLGVKRTGYFYTSFPSQQRLFSVCTKGAENMPSLRT